MIFRTLSYQISY